MAQQTIHEFQGDFRWLSNFWPSKIVWAGMQFRTVEHAFQAAKTLDPLERKKIQECSTPGQAKRVGKTVTLQEGWELSKIAVMRNLLRQKFSHVELREALLNTGNAVLIEGNAWGDTFWGICNGEGQNHLGILLMEIREEIWQSNHAL